MENKKTTTGGQTHQDLEVRLEPVKCEVWSALRDSEKRFKAIEVCRRLGIPNRLQSLTWDGHFPEIESVLREISGHDLSLFDYNKPNSVILAGPVGTGKSAFLSAMAKEAFITWANSKCRKEDPDGIVVSFMRGARYITYRNLATMIREEIDNPGYETSEFYERVTLLIIDDLLDGVVKDYDMIKLGAIIDSRYINHRPTWISTNSSAEDMAKFTGFERSYSRLADTSWCLYTQVLGDDRRRV